MVEVYDRRKRNEETKTKPYYLIVVGLFILLILFGSFRTIDAGERGVLLTWGEARDVELKAGFHWKIPIAQKIVKMDVRKQKLEADADSSSKDLQDVQTRIALNYHIMPSGASELYQEIGHDYRSRIIAPAIQESIKAVSAKFTAEELITKRPDVRQQVKDFISERLDKYHIAVDDFNIVNFQFSPEFDKAIEEKVTAEQLKLKAERDLERIKIEKEQKITQAQAEAEALKLQKQEITEDLIELRKIEMQREAIAKWDGIMPKVTGGAIPFIDVGIKE